MKPAINGDFIKEKIQEDLEQQAPPKQSQESNPNARTHETSPGNTSSEFITNESIANDLDCPIALRKGRRSCTSHPIYNFVSYKGLSPSFQTFVANLNKVQVPNSIQEAISILEWKTAVWEEM